MYCPKCGAQVAPSDANCSTCGANLQPAVAPPNPYLNQPVYTSPVGMGPAVSQAAWDYASWGTRAIGYIIDVLLIGVGMAILYFVLGALSVSMFHLAMGRDAGQGLCCMWIILFPVASLLVGLYNNVTLVAQRGYSIGQGVVKVMVVNGNGQLLTFGSALVRLLVRVVFAFVPVLPLLDLLWPLWDDRRQTLHDKAVGCYVINMGSRV